MNRKMTFFAFPGYCGALGASGLDERVAAAALVPPASSSASEIAPRPTPHCSKNQRRLTVCGPSPDKDGPGNSLWDIQLTDEPSVPGYSLVMVSSKLKRTLETAVQPAS